MKTIKYTGLFIISLSLSACNEFLSHQPDNRTKLDTAEKISELLVSAYPEANYITFCEAMTDNVSEHPGGYIDNTNSDPYFWKDGSQTQQDSPEFYWASCYAAIAAANHALDAIAQSDDPSQYNAQKGEALVARAYSHFMLVTLFAKIYDKTTASKDPGIPYVTEPETVALKKYERGTVESVYNKIEEDFKTGIPLINDDSYTVPSYHFTKSAAHAFAVRFYLFKEDYKKVIEHANQVFPDNDFASRLRPWNSAYRNYAFDELITAYTKASEKANILLCETSSLWARTLFAFRYSTGIDELDDIRSIAQITGGSFAYTVYYNSNTSIYYIPKFKEHFVRDDISSNIGLPYTIVPLFTAEEVLLSRAEALAFDGKYSSAISDLNTFFSKRITDYNPALHTLTATRMNNFLGTTNTLGSIWYTTLLCRRAEFLHEGLWWFDILRNGFEVNHTTVDGTVYTLDSDDPRRVLQIPRESIELAGLEPNPR